MYLVLGLVSLATAVADTARDLHAADYISVAKKFSTPHVDSEFWRTEYKAPGEVEITFPQNKKNLIIILMESMESSFADTQSGGLMETNLIPRLTDLAQKNVNFSGTESLGGGIDLSGTGWTVAAMTAKFSGLPFNLVGRVNASRIEFLPGAVTLTDILSQNGYRQRFLFGSDKRFAGRSALLETHGNVEVHDTVWYKEHKKIPEEYHVFWGFEDEKLFAFAKEELSDLAAGDGPFMLGLLTVDTHMPQGWQCRLCPDDEELPYHNVLKCADAQAADFVEWCSRQPWYDDTVIAIMGDHRFMATAETNPFADGAYLEGGEENPRRWLDIFINAAKAPLRPQNRTFSSLDMFPTMLSALGCTIPGDRLGFGTDLFSGEPTLCERYPIDLINWRLMERTTQYTALEFPSGTTPE